MTTETVTGLRIETLALPFEGPPAVPAARPGGGRVLALAAHGGDGRLIGVIAGRQRRTALAMRVFALEASAGCGPALARVFVKMARAGGTIALRCAEELTAAAELLDLAPSGRGYRQRWLAEALAPDPGIGTFQQTTGFTCGPASLAMALSAEVTRDAEIALWREATTVIGLGGPGGCDPYGLALAAARRAGPVTLYIDTDEPVLLDRADTPAKRDLMRFVQAGFKAEAQQALAVVPRAATMEELRSAVAKGARALLLVDQRHTHDHAAPHWLLLHAAAGELFLVNDPWIEATDGEILADGDCLPMTAAALERMSRYGEPPYRAAIVIG